MKHDFSDFSGGLSDFKFNTASNFAERIDNWLVLRDKSIEVRYGFDFWNLNAPRIPVNQRISEIANVGGEFVFFSNGSIYYNNNGMVSLLGPTGNKALSSAGPDTMVTVDRWGDHYIVVDDSYSFPIKLFKDENGLLKFVNAGLPKLFQEFTVSPSSNDEARYIYAIVNEYEYRIGTTVYLDLSEPVYVTVEEAADPSTSSNVLNDISDTDNGTLRNYDIQRIRKRIYRTQNAGSTLYFVASIPQGQTMYVDTTSDDDLTAGDVLYTQGGVKGNEQPPQSKYLTISSNVGWYGNVIESAEVKPFRLRFSKVGDIDSCPSTFYEDFESSITGLASIEDKVIVFTEKNTIRVEGVLDDLGRGSISRGTIIDAPCISNGSIVQTQDYVYFFSDSGIYRTNGIQAEKLTNHLDLTYQKWTSSTEKRRRIKGSYDQVNQRVYWCVSESDSDNDKILVFDEIHRGFSTQSSGSDFSPTAIIFKNQEMIRGDKDGYIFLHEEGIYSDLVKDPYLPVGSWRKKVIPYDWKHIAWDFGDSQRVKWINKIGVTGRPKTNVYLEPRSYSEGSDDYYRLSHIGFNPLIVWGDSSILWGSIANRWNSVDYLNAAKRMNRRAKRATHLQLSFASATVTILSSGENPNSYVVVDSSSKSISLANPTVYKFPLNTEGYQVIIDGISYTIQSGSESVLIVDNLDSTLINGTYPYEIKGEPKAQRPHISNVSINFEYFGDMDKLTESAN